MFSLKIDEDPSLADFVDSKKALEKVLSGEYMVCTLCKEQDKNLGACLRKLLIGKPSNGTTHLKDAHKERAAQLVKAAKEEAKAQGSVSTLVSPCIMHVTCVSFLNT